MENDKNTLKLSHKIVSHKQKKPTARQKKNQDRVQDYLKKCVSSMKQKQEKLMSQHKFGEKNNKFVLYPERNAFFLFNKETKNVFFKAKFQIIGTYSEKSKTWRWGWSNRYVPYDLKQTALKIKNFGEANKMDLLSEPKIKNEDMGLIFTALGMELSRSQGYYIVPGNKVYPAIYLIFTQVKNIKEKYEDIVAEMRANHRANHKLMRDKLKEIKPIKKDTLVSKKKTTVSTSQKSSKNPTSTPKIKPNSKPKKNKTQPNLRKKIVSTTKSTKKVLNPTTKIHLVRSHQVRTNENNFSVNSDNMNNNNNNKYLPLESNRNQPKKQILIPVKTKKKTI